MSRASEPAARRASISRSDARRHPRRGRHFARFPRPALLVAAAAVAVAMMGAGVVGLTQLGNVRKVAAAEALYDKGRYEQAEALLRDVLARDGRNTSALRALARVLAAGGHTKDALATYAKAVSRDPADGPTLAAMASLERLTGDAPRAAVHFEAAIRADPANPTYKDQLARTLLQLGRSAKAAAVWGEVAADERAPSGERRQAGLAEGQAWLAAGQTARARAAFTRVLALAPGDRQAALLLQRTKQ